MKKFKTFISNINFSGVSKGTIMRGVLAIVVIINYVLSVFGVNPLAIDSNLLSQIVVVVITVLTIIASYWKNNSFTQAAQDGDAKMVALKSEVVDTSIDTPEEVAEAIDSAVKEVKTVITDAEKATSEGIVDDTKPVDVPKA
jgi:SPP1 family holin